MKFTKPFKKIQKGFLLFLGTFIYTLAIITAVFFFYPITLGEHESSMNIAWLLIFGIFFAPIFEEAIFRGPLIYCIKKNKSIFHISTTLLFSLGVFSILHGQKWLAIILSFSFALTYFAIIFKSIWVNILMHSLFNGIQIIFYTTIPFLKPVLMDEHEKFNAAYSSYPIFIFVSVVTTGFFIFLIHLNRKKLKSSFSLINLFVRDKLIKKGWLNKAENKHSET